MSLGKRLKHWERNWRHSFNVDPRIAGNERRAQIYNDWFDHAILRRVWTNFFQIAPGVYRSNQPTHRRFEKIKSMGITHVLNLRGQGTGAAHLTEKKSCQDLGLTLINCQLSARQAAPAENILQVIETFKTIPHPFVMHCKSGADRAGFASAIYLITMQGQSVQQARKMLAVKYAHLRFTKTGVLDYILRSYDASNSQQEISFEDWIRTAYDPQKLQTDFNNRVPILS
ncbi:dual specificity protein phosphatase family protein [Cognatishimia sp. WU-CL00825]|uniref:phosphatase domain-containing protein n=1 Tax=Cognatishimia sp. WU-CL00825 TaxID=3127658 RepID=UPI003106E48B